MPVAEERSYACQACSAWGDGCITVTAPPPWQRVDSFKLIHYCIQLQHAYINMIESGAEIATCTTSATCTKAGERRSWWQTLE